ncbi:MAG TPA: TolC family protein [Polyangia bacterium]|nr:TolC family protein [Polyangia bacterium]
MNLALTVFLAGTKVLTLSEALQTAQKDQPTVHQARANTEAAKARVGEARAPLLPQIFGTATYSRLTTNPTGGALATIGGGSTGPTMTAPPSWNTIDRWNFGITAQQTLWDASGQLARWRQNAAFAEGVEDTERATRLTVALNVRTFYFAARANKALVQVARDTLANQQRHLDQVAGFVRVGTQPEIALAQQRTAVANAQVQVISAENNYEVAKAQLNQAIGLERDTAYDVEDESTPPIAGEDQATDPLLAEALKARPDYLSLEKQVQAQELAIWAAKTSYGPNLAASTSFTDGGQFLDQLGWNWSFNLTLNWQLFQGGLTWYTVKEQKANLDGIEAQRDLVRQQVRLGVEQARLAVRAAKAALGAANEAEVNAKEQLRLAEGRYQAGVGSIIELGDAQVAATTAAAQKVQADYNVSTARAQLLNALGRF